jgi:ankyrin repeat protein
MSNPYSATLPGSPDLAQQRKRAKDLLKSVRAGDAAALDRLRYNHPRFAVAADSDLRAARLHDAQWAIAREYGFSSWIKLKTHIDEIAGATRRPYRAFETDLEYYRERASGLVRTAAARERNALRLVREFHPAYARASDDEIAANVTQEDAELVHAREHGFDNWNGLAARVEQLKADPAIEPFRPAFDAIQAKDDAKLAALLKQTPSLAQARGTNGNHLLHFAVNHPDNLRLVGVLLEAGADPDAANDKGATPLTQAAYGGKVGAIELLLAEGASVDAEAYGDGGTPLAFALFWGHREAADKLAEIAVAPRNLRIAAGLGRVDILAEFFDAAGNLSPEAGFHREFHRPHTGFPFWQPGTDPQGIIDEALNWAARSGRMAAMAFLFARGANLDSAPYQATPLTQAVLNGQLDAIAWLLDHGADIGRKSAYGEPQGGTPLHFAAAWGGQLQAAKLVARGADLAIRDDSDNAPPAGWANHFQNKDIEAFLVEAAKAKGL